MKADSKVLNKGDLSARISHAIGIRAAASAAESGAMNSPDISLSRAGRGLDGGDMHDKAGDRRRISPDRPKMRGPDWICVYTVAFIISRALRVDEL